MFIFKHGKNVEDSDDVFFSINHRTATLGIWNKNLLEDISILSQKDVANLILE